MKVQNTFDNKKIGELVCDGAMKFVQNFAVEINGERVAEYLSLDAVAKDWKDYKPVEPLIKDEKVRKFVQDWAKFNEIERARIYHQTSDDSWFQICGQDKKSKYWTIQFRASYSEAVSKDYDETFVGITELCGEEK